VLTAETMAGYERLPDARRTGTRRTARMRTVNPASPSMVTSIVH